MGMPDLDIQMKKILDQYIEETEKEVDAIAEELADKGVETLRATSPKKTGKYAKSWKKRVEVTASGSKEFVIHNTQAGLTHLLERGHALHQGGRARAFPHIGPVEQQIIQEFIKRLTP